MSNPNKYCKICNSEFTDPYLMTDICIVCTLKPGYMPIYTSKGTKNDQAKPDLSLIPKDPLWELAKVLMAGEKKYGRWNWQNGIEVSRLTAAAMRHITQFNDGELIDEETQTSHLINACANLFFAFWMLKNKPEYDNVTKKKP